MVEYGRNMKNALLLLTTDIKFTPRPASKNTYQDKWNYRAL